MNAYRTTDTAGSAMIVMGTSTDHAREVATQILRDHASDYPDIINRKLKIATVSNL